MSAIYDAAKAGDIPLIERLISEGVDLGFCDENDEGIPLVAACLSDKAGVDAVRILIDAGSDVNALAKGGYWDGWPLLSLILSGSSISKIRLLITLGANLSPQIPNGYTLLTLAACANRIDVFELLLSHDAPINGKSSYRESALSVLSTNGRFAQIRKLLDLGAHPKALEWTPLHLAVALEDADAIKTILDQGEDLEALDFWERTPFLLSLQTGEVKKAELLLSRGANRNAKGRCGKTAMQYSVVHDDAFMIPWLIKNGFDLNAKDDFGNTALMDAVEDSAIACFKVLIAAGAGWEKEDNYYDALIREAGHPEIVETLIEMGAHPAKLNADVLRTMMGLETRDELPVDKEEFLREQTRRFGKENPEKMAFPFWEAMLRCGWNAWRAGQLFGISSYDEKGTRPIWSHVRFGISLTILPDGRFVQIAGEYEDHYDPDFCIYNDVVVHDGKGGIEIFGYPKIFFPPTDFHSATLVGKWIYILGNLGYPETRREFGDEMPVFRLKVGTWEIEKVQTSGELPGWIHDHKAVIAENGLRISGAKF